MKQTSMRQVVGISTKHRPLTSRMSRFWRAQHFLALSAALGWTLASQAGTITIPNHSFESPAVPPTAPYASPEIDDWQKSAQPVWYDPSQNADTPWAYLMGCFYNVPFPGQFIDNCDGNQATFLFALPEAALFQDYDSVSGTNTTPTHAFDARFAVGRAYTLTAGVIGGGGGMKPGATLELGLFYRDAASNLVTVASTVITNSTDVFPTNTHFVDFQVQLPTVQETNAWAGKHIGIRLLSTTSFDLAGGYWDLDNVRLLESTAGEISLGLPALSNGQFTFAVQSVAGATFELLTTTNAVAVPSEWRSLGFFTNSTGMTNITAPATNSSRGFFRVRQL